MLISLRELELHRISVSKIYPPGALNYHEARFHQVGPLKVEAVAELVEKEIGLRGSISTRVESACDRCLGEVELPVESHFDLIFRPMAAIAREEEIELPGDELRVGFYSGEGVDLNQVVAEQVLLSVPMKVLCRPDCLGLCPTCGANRNVEQCGCSSQREDSPFAFLKK